ncbi:MAG TPA: S8 family serine peptidase [Candidatus Limnocylindria bacterium]|jgi:subtilisin family serine protease|nr:S8 family serine peptidase [Candidatus Limnocylindria bacterium]
MVEEEEPLAWSEPFAGHDQLARVAGLRTVDRDWAWGGADGRGVTVAIIDSGVERDHPKVRGRLVESVAVRINDEGEPVVEPDESGVDLFGHGTACAGIIIGLAPAVEIVSVRVLGADLKGKGVAFAAGLEWAVERRVQVANLSLSSKSETLFPIFHELADDAYFNNVVLVSAANNVPVPSYPSLFASVISVAGHAEPDPLRFYYNPAPPVEFGAWGVDVPIAWKDGAEIVATGNSFAAPHIAGLVALIVSKHPGLTPFEVKSILAATADNAGAAASS